jgi:hypothetical protein
MEPYLDWKEVTLIPADLTGYTTAIDILDPIASDEFYEIVKILIKVDFDSVAYDYASNIDFEIGGERMMRFQSDVISSSNDVVSLGNAILCQDTCAPYIGIGETLKMRLDGTPPTVGDSLVYIKVWYYKHSF